MLGPFFRCLKTLLHTTEFAVGAVLTFLGGILQLNGIADIELWWWLALWVAILFVMAVHLQRKLDSDPHVEKLWNRSYVSCAEIAEAVAKENKAYDKSDVLKALRKALERGEFKSWTGLSRMRVIMRDSECARTGGRPFLHPDDLFEYWRTGETTTKGTVAYSRAELWTALNGGEAIEALILEAPEFHRWYRRFRRYKYER